MDNHFNGSYDPIFQVTITIGDGYMFSEYIHLVVNWLLLFSYHHSGLDVFIFNFVIPTNYKLLLMQLIFNNMIKCRYL